MRLLRNREVRSAFLLLLLLAAAGMAACFVIAPAAGFIAAGVFALFLAVFYRFTAWRYAQLDRLNAYLKRVNGGDYALDVRDNTEGELSILRNELYKVTVMLREQNENLAFEKTKLADALADISHQLKTPMTSMFVMTDLLCGADLPAEKRAAFTDRMKAQLVRIEWLVSSLLKLSRLDAKTVRFDRRAVPLRDLLQSAGAPMLIPMELKDQALVLDDGGIEAVCDANWTAEAVVNILKNCVEHTPAGGRIAVTCAQNPIYTQITIEDSGPGISKEDLPRVFDRFYRGANASADSIGIGLSMAAAIVREQGGTIAAKNGASGGAVFTIRFFRETQRTS